MVKLLTVKAGESYCRFEEDSFELCKMNKASVYPVSELDRVKKAFDIAAKVHPDAQIIQMVITEEVFVGE